MWNLAFRMVFCLWCSVIVSATALHSIPAFAVDSQMQLTGAQFSEACTRPNENWISFCNGYVQAVIDGIREDDQVCLAEGTTRTELVTISEREITASRQLRAMNAHDAVRLVLRRFYSCG